MKRDKTPSYVKIGILTVITTIAWVFFGAYRTLTAKPAPNVPTSILNPFSSNLETDKISEIEGRIFFEEGQTSTLVVSSPSPTPETEAPLETEPPLEIESSPTPDPDEIDAVETESPSPSPTDSEGISL